MKKGAMAILLVSACSIAPASALDPPHEILALYYVWSGYVDECVDKSPDITADVREKVRGTAQSVEEMILASRPEDEREQFKQKALSEAAEALSRLKREAAVAQDPCGDARAVLTSWSSYTMNLDARIREMERLRRLLGGAR